MEYLLESFDGLTHRAEFRIRVHENHDPELRLILPVWAPGTYEIRDSAREIAAVRATGSRAESTSRSGSSFAHSKRVG